MSQINFEELLAEVKALNEKNHIKQDEWILKAELKKDINDLLLAKWGCYFLSNFPVISDKEN